MGSTSARIEDPSLGNPSGCGSVQKQVIAKPRLLMAIVVALVSVVIATSSASAGHSITSPPRYWDLDNDGVAEASDAKIGFDRDGSSWGPSKEARFVEAMDEWRDTTDWKPRLDRDSFHDVLIDGQYGPCLGSWANNPGVYAVACPILVRRLEGTPDEYDDIVAMDIYFNVDGHNWDWTNTGWDPDNRQVSFRGILTHELGHGGGLGHRQEVICPDGVDIYTMCPFFTKYESYQAESLRDDDRDSADRTYLP